MRSSRSPILSVIAALLALPAMTISAGAAIPAANPRLVAIRSKLGDIEVRQGKLRALRRARITMTPDRFVGADLSALRAKAIEVLRKAHPGAKVLRATIISADWKEERVKEFTDTTRTKARYRVTRSVTAQVAGKRGREVFLFTLHIAKDRINDGPFGALRGHVMFTEAMLEKNVGK